jgi:macrodomain Ter protein organizer (MatP/YcbG family)
MPRTTVDLDADVLKELKERARREGKTLGAAISELAAQGLRSSESDEAQTPVRWHSRPIGLKVDLRDKQAVYEALERE